MVKIYAKDKGANNPPHDLVSDTVVTWGVGTYAYTQLVNHLNQVYISSKLNILFRLKFYNNKFIV